MLHSVTAALILLSSGDAAGPESATCVPQILVRHPPPLPYQQKSCGPPGRATWLG